MDRYTNGRSDRAYHNHYHHYEEECKRILMNVEDKLENEQYYKDLEEHVAKEAKHAWKVCAIIVTIWIGIFAGFQVAHELGHDLISPTQMQQL